MFKTSVRELFHDYCKTYCGILPVGDEHTEELFQAFHEAFYLALKIDKDGTSS
jgi:hypothetical protein